MGFCTPTDYLEFMRQAPEFERMLVRSGIRLFKFWFSVTPEEQRRRFAARETDPAETLEAVPHRQGESLANGMNTRKPRKRCSSIPITGPMHRGRW